MSQTTSGHSPEDFDWILVQFNNDDVEPIIVAGQAVNIWGKTFREWDAKYNPTRPKINNLLPLTSNDMELLEFRGVSALGKFKGVVGSEKTTPFAKAAAPDIPVQYAKPLRRRSRKKTPISPLLLSTRKRYSHPALRCLLLYSSLLRELSSCGIPFFRRGLTLLRLLPLVSLKQVWLSASASADFISCGNKPEYPVHVFAHNNYRGLFMTLFQFRKIAMAALAAAVSLNTLTTKLQAHGLEGDRFFPPTPLTDDPFAVDELSLPEIQYNPASASNEVDITGSFSKEILEAVSGFVWFWFVTAQMSDQSPWGILDEADLSAVLWQTQFGQLWLGRAAVGVALGVVLCFVSRKKARASLQPSRWNWLVLAISGVLLITLAWAGHGASGIRYHDLHLFADTLHLLIGAIWPMGLIPMVCFLWYIHKRNQVLPADREIRALQRFSQISLVAVLLIVATGIINGWLMVGSWEALVTTTYGALLLGKVVVVGIMIGLGAFNRLYLLPRMQAAPILFRTLRRTILAESGLALVVLFIVGTMGMTAPPS